MKKTDLKVYERRVSNIAFVAPGMPDPYAIFCGLVRDRRLWTEAEYEYVRDFHRVYGFDPDAIYHALAADEWLHWHLLAVKRYRQMASKPHMPVQMAHSWSYHYHAKAEPDGFIWDRGNTVPYDVASLRERGWTYLDHNKAGVVFSTEQGALALVEEDVTILFADRERLTALQKYLVDRDAIRAKYNVRAIVSEQDLEIYEPDAGYSFVWETGALIPGGYHDQIMQMIKR